MPTPPSTLAQVIDLPHIEVPVAELVRTNDPVVISVVEGLLIDDAIPYQVADRNMSVIEGSIGAFQIRILVPDEYLEVARQLVVEAELGSWLS